MEASTPWLCPTCRHPVESRFCPSCGEQPTGPRHLTVHELGREALKVVGSLDGKLLRSLRTLLIQPGELTVAYVAGRRKPFVGPLSLFLAANAAFFAVQSISKNNIFATPLAAHLTHQDWSALARALTDRKLAANHMTLQAYTPLFDQAAVLHAKTLIFLMPLAFCAAPALLFARSRRPLAMHGVFALHLYAFLLLLFCVALSVSIVSAALGGPGLDTPVMDAILSVFNLAACGTYLFLAIGTVYGDRGVTRAVRTVLLTAAVAGLVLGYRFGVFLITLWAT